MKSFRGARNHSWWGALLADGLTLYGPRQRRVQQLTKWLCAVSLMIFYSGLTSAQSLVFMADINGRYGNLGYHPRVAAAVARIIELRPVAVVLAGDMIAAQATPTLPAEQLRRMWGQFDRVVAAPLRAAGITVIPVAGNHDASAYPRFATDREAYENYWLAHPPPLQPVAGSRYPWHYTVTIGGFRVVALYATAPGVLDAAQQTFLELLLTAGQTAVPPTLVVGHLPVHPVARGREREIIDVSDLSLGRVDAWFSGHHHAYYPGITDSGSRHIAVPALGGNQRVWMQSNAFGPFGFVHVSASGAVSLYAAPTFEPHQLTVIPERIGALRLMREPAISDNKLSRETGAVEVPLLACLRPLPGTLTDTIAQELGYPGRASNWDTQGQWGAFQRRPG